ncbi:MAG TPA: MBL fold metallo-hydrolase [bacterium]|nr:MBL fold metallo-hydrolase [bacterium]
MCKSSMMLGGLTLILTLGLALGSGPALAGERAASASHAASSAADPAGLAPTPTADPASGPMLVAEGEGDIDESYTAHGADTDEEMETDNAKVPPDTTKNLIKGLRWFSQSAFLLEDTKNIYFDPFQLSGKLPPADIILITHDHFDHLSPADVAKIIKPTTVVISVPAALAKLPKQGVFKAVKPGDTLTVEGIKIEAVPAYNIDKQYHPKEKAYVGFIVHVGGRTFYHAGDTDLIPEMKDFKVDVAMLPIGGTYTMTATEAAKAANIIKPKVAIPMHYGAVVGSIADAQTFKAEAKVPVIIMQPETKAAKPAKPEKGSK